MSLMLDRVRRLMFDRECLISVCQRGTRGPTLRSLRPVTVEIRSDAETRGGGGVSGVSRRRHGWTLDRPRGNVKGQRRTLETKDEG